MNVFSQNPTNHKTLVIAVGNEILGDDAVGFYAARVLRTAIGAGVDIIEASGTGFALMDLMEGYDNVLLIDSIVTENTRPGTIHQFTPEDFKDTVSSSPHYTGIPELFQLANQLKIRFPRNFLILAMEIEKDYTFREGLTESVEKSLPKLIDKAKVILRSWHLNPHVLPISAD
jgi:hydrogenase maturation protease